VYQPDDGATVTISGLNAVDNNGWTVHNGNVYKKSITLPVNGYAPAITSNTTLLANQVFKDGVMMFEARWPKLNTVDDLMDQKKLRHISATISFTNTSITDNGMPSVPGGLAGGKVIVEGWFMTQMRNINSHSGNTITFGGTDSNPWFRKYYFVTGKLGLLTQAKEWHYESGTLYFWQEGGGSPTGVEYKARNWGFDLRGKSNITIAGLRFIGCEPMTGNTGSANTILDNIRASYMNHAVLDQLPSWPGFGNARMTGTKLVGPNSVIKNSELKIASSMGVWLGANCRAENNLIHDIGYEGNWGAPFSLWERDGGQVITRNTLYRTGRSCVDFGYLNNGQHLNVEVSYNDMSRFGMTNWDLGATYAWGQSNLTGLNHHHNWIHDCASPTGSDAGIQVGIYFDQASGPGTVHHNVTWNCVDSDVYHEVTNHERQTNTVINFYNNTFTTTGVMSSYRTYVTFPHDVQRNNIYRSPVIVNWGASAGNVANSLLSTTNPSFVGNGGGGLNYRLQAGSPGINAGAVIPGITDGSVGAPDIGAYEFGGEAWVPGYKAVPFGNAATNSPPVGTITSPANNATVAQGTAVTINASASDANGSVAKVEFFNGTTKLGEDTASPYTYSWVDAQLGTHSLTVKVTDNQNAIGTSAAVSITVNVNTAPTVAITAPTVNSQFDTGAGITISATAADANGSVAKVEFFNGTTKLGEDLTNPYSFAWNNAAPGDHTITVKATDNQNNTTTSTAVQISVVNLVKPVVAITSPAPNAQFTLGGPITIAAAATDANGTITKVEFFNGTTKLGEDLTSPYSFIWGNAPIGNHSLTARATDNENNLSTSTAVAISVSTNSPPVVLITSPLTSAEVNIRSTISITVSASDANGNVAKVEFFTGTTKLGEDLTSPYGFIWSNAPAGDHSLTAKATDNLGAIGTSGVVNILVVDPSSPTVNAGADKIVTLPDNSATLIPAVVPAVPVQYTWSQLDGPNNVTMTGTDTDQLSLTDLIEGTYIFEISVTGDNGLTGKDQIRVTVVGAGETTAAIPRFFSPNDDGNGDVWEWQNTEQFENSVLTIFNRAGQKIYEALSYKNTWDGKMDGQPLQAGDYYYIIRLADLTDLRGAVRIIR
jgi:gliding motility-associated-like protein